MKRLPKRSIADLTIERHDSSIYLLTLACSTRWYISGDAIRELMRYVEESESDEKMPPEAAKALIAQWAKELEEEHA